MILAVRNGLQQKGVPDDRILYEAYGPLANRSGADGIAFQRQLKALAKTVANRVFFMDAGQIIEDNEPEEFFNNLQNERTQLFLSQILQH